VLEGRAFLIDSLWSAAARRRMAERGPPGGEPARATEVPLDLAALLEESGPESGPEFRGEAGRAEDCVGCVRILVACLDWIDEFVRTRGSVSQCTSSGGNVP
jgi:hypothetical protein